MAVSLDIGLGDRLDRPIRVLDIGAMEEGKPRYAALDAAGLVEIHLVEPNAAERAKLEAKGLPRRHIIPHALGDGGDHTLNITRYPGCTSLLEPDPGVIDRFVSIGATLPNGNFAVVDRQPVTTVRLDDLPDLPEFDLIKLDIQGAEAMVLAHGRSVLRPALFVESEVSFVRLYKDQPLFGHLQVQLDADGFDFHKLVDIAGRCFAPLHNPRNPFAAISQALWADAIFVASVFDLGAWQPERLLRAAVVADAVYESWDLCQNLLAEYDRRSGTALVDAYLARLSSRPDNQRLYMTLKEHP